VTIAAILIAHGSHEFFGAFGTSGAGPGGLSATAARFEAAGLAPGFPMAVLSSVLQLMTGALIVVGLLTRWAALSALVYLTVVAWTTNLRWGFFLNWVFDPGRGHGVEYALLLSAALACLALTGAGDLSIDGRRAQSVARQASARARLHKRM
jgi:putative oxidoreductase